MLRRTICVMLLATASAVLGDELAGGFVHPPDTARPWVYWFIMDGNVSRAGITADLESMKAAGIGGAILMEVDVGIPRGPVAFMSAAWRDLFKHAVEEAERLGLEITLNAGPGWTGSGGPWVRPEQSMQHLVSSSVEVEGPVHFSGVLPRPDPRPPYFGEAGLPESLLAARHDFYADEAVLAVPRSGDSRIGDVDEKALYLREPFTSKPGVKPFIPAPARYPDLPPGEALSKDAMVDLTGSMEPDGRLNWDVPAGEWTILRFGRRNTGANTRPAPQSGLGLESDKFSRAALDAHFDAYIGKLLEAVGPRPLDRTTGWTMLHIDSWEMGSQNWTAGFGGEFQRRRGYDPRPYLPVMTGRFVESAEHSERFLWDLRLTAQELVIENHAGHLKELGRRNGFGLSIEPYDMNPTADMTLGGVADVPMCEFWAHGYGFDSTFTCFESTSIGHTLGRPVVAAEAFTSGSEEAWRLYPALMKNQGDWAFCTGINRIVFHRFAHQPWPDRRPGMTMGPYGVHWDRTQTWWPMAPEYHRYLARCQFLLRQGATVADTCYLVPEGAPHVFRPPPTALTGKLGDRRGYNFDGCTPETLLERARVEDGRIVLPGGADYRLLVLPASDTMTPGLLRKIAALVESGATVIGSPPAKSPSLSNYPQCDQEVQALSAKLWGETEPPPTIVEHAVGQGRLVWGGPLGIATPGAPYPDPSAQPHWMEYPDYEATASVLDQMGVPPDFEADGPVRYTHRRTGEEDLYFVANQTDKAIEASCTFRATGRQPELWNPVTGTIQNLSGFSQRGGCTSISIRFEPYQSFFIVFRQRVAGDAPDAPAPVNFPIARPAATIEGPWEVSFAGAPGEPQSVSFASLTDWTDRPEAGIKYYSGIATYTRTFDLPESLHGEAQAILLDLGEVHSMARVRLNGTELGVVWCAPWRVDITGVAAPKENRLEIEIANLWPNRLIGDSALSEERRLAWTTWNPYQPDSPLLPSGLLGPVQLLTYD